MGANFHTARKLNSGRPARPSLGFLLCSDATIWICIELITPTESKREVPEKSPDPRLTPSSLFKKIIKSFYLRLIFDLQTSCEDSAHLPVTQLPPVLAPHLSMVPCLTKNVTLAHCVRQTSFQFPQFSHYCLPLLRGPIQGDTLHSVPSLFTTQPDSWGSHCLPTCRPRPDSTQSCQETGSKGMVLPLFCLHFHPCLFCNGGHMSLCLCHNP